MGRHGVARKNCNEVKLVSSPFLSIYKRATASVFTKSDVEWLNSLFSPY